MRGGADVPVNGATHMRRRKELPAHNVLAPAIADIEHSGGARDLVAIDLEALEQVALRRRHREMPAALSEWEFWALLVKRG